MKDAGLSNSPSARRFEVTDEQLSAELKQWTGASPALHPVGELLDRHWAAAFVYARLCADGERAAGMLTTAAFTRLFGEALRQNGPTAAWRPHLLVTVRRIAAEWDSDGRRDLLHPDLRSAAGDTERLAARLLPPPHRRLLSRAFQRLPQSAGCLLWHAEVEAEPLAVPAGLLGMEEDGARVELRRAHDRLREECLQLHRELAVDEDCHRYDRLLDVTCRRGGADMDPDLRAHLDQCRHCAHTADQLRQFDGHLGAALAEGVLGWAAAEYMALRASGLAEPAGEPAAAPAAGPGGVRPAVVGEAFTDGTYDMYGADAPAPTGPRPEADPLPAAGPRRGTGRRPGSAPQPDTGARPADSRPASRRSAQKAARRARRRNLAAAVLTVSGLIVLPLVVWSALGSGDGSAPGTGDEAGQTPGPAKDTATSGPSWVGAGEDVQGTLRGRLHNVSSGLCVAVAGDKAVKGAETVLAACSSAAGQQWTYETDGLLRNTQNPDLCLDSQLGFSVRLSPCTAGAKNIRYDFTLQGTLVPRGNQNLALAPAATDGSGAVVLKNREDSAAQRWVIDTSQPDPQLQVVNWDADVTADPTPTPKAAKTPTPTPTPKPSVTPTAPRPTAPSSSPGSDSTSCSYPYGYYCSWNGQSGSYGGSGYGGSGYGGSGYGYGGPGYGYGGQGWGADGGQR
ncbi:ricin-type beta-trefoil lectin domain protein [Streptomyces sp. NEAU-NA10]|uniref:ricin-type beta-trefoil lectin domain protein n=1 Tax=Streptomyces sp. NEAU-NA10 TaxID=3416050 RepID=UPI003CC6AC17